jgi:hypothetical protein
MKSINENTSLALSLLFKDKDQLPVTPDTVSYSIYDEKSGTAIIAESVITVTENPHVLIIPVDSNMLVDPTNLAEKRIVTIKFTYNGGTEGLGTTYAYNITSLKYG